MPLLKHGWRDLLWRTLGTLLSLLPQEPEIDELACVIWAKVNQTLLEIRIRAVNQSMSKAFVLPVSLLKEFDASAPHRLPDPKIGQLATSNAWRAWVQRLVYPARERSKKADQLAHVCRSSLDVAKDRGLTSIAFGDFTHGLSNHVSSDEIAQIALQTVIEKLAIDTHFECIEFICLKHDMFMVFDRVLREMAHQRTDVKIIV
jgi:O-acetyl-ADP-ribose deacetylase (regulator of RNase III)